MNRERERETEKRHSIVVAVVVVAVVVLFFFYALVSVFHTEKRTHFEFTGEIRFRSAAVENKKTRNKKKQNKTKNKRRTKQKDREWLFYRVVPSFLELWTFFYSVYWVLPSFD